MQQTSSGKNSTAGIVIAFLCIIVYLAVLIISGARIFSSIDQRRDTALEEFESIKELAITKGEQGFMNKPFVETINNALAKSRTIEAIIISGPNGEYAFEKEPGKAIIWVNNSPRFRNRIDFSRQPLYQSLRIQNLRNVNMEARAGVVDYVYLSRILKQGLLMILIPLVIAGFTLLMEFLLKGSQYRISRETGTIRLQGSFAENGFGKAAADKGGETSIGAHSNHANIGWEEYAAGQLDTELRRCAAEGQDLVVFSSKIKNAGESSYRCFTGEAAEFFASRELVFEKGERGITAIYPNISLEAGFSKAEEFHRRLIGKYPQTLQGVNIYIGLSARAGRNVDAERLLFEAEEALQRASQDSASPIVAFKSDPDKYREFISRKG